LTIFGNQMKKFSLLFLLLFFCNIYPQIDYRLTKTDDSIIVLDGVLSKEEKGNSIIVPIEFEQEPGDNVPSKLKTDVFVTYTDTYLYVGVKAFGDPRNIRGQVKPRDQVDYQNEDIIFLRFDPFRDSRLNYILGANAFASQLDLRVFNATSERDSYDGGFNAIYETKSSIVEDGYILEFKVPFSSLPYPKGINQVWNFNVSRVYTLNGTFYRNQSQPYDRSDPCWVCQVTDKLIMDDIKFKGKTELLPFVTSNISGKKNNSVNDPIEYGKINGDIGIGLNYDFSPSSSIELTLNPDFSQIEADVTQIDINSAYALEYPELRPFFNKGMELLNFMDGAFYSRTINSPSFSSKLVSLTSSSGTIMLNAIDETSPYLIGGEDKSYFGDGGISYINTIRHQKIINEGNKFGVYGTSRYFKDGGYGNLIGIDGLFTFNKIWRFQFEINQSFTKEPKNNWIDTEDTFLDKTIKLDGEKFKGSGNYFRLSRNTEHWDTYLFYRAISPGYRADVGFVPRINRKWTTIYHGYKSFFEKEYLQEFSIGLKGDLTYNFDNKIKSRNLDFDISIKTFGKTLIQYNYDINFLRNYLNIDFKNVGKSELTIMAFPNEDLSLMLKHVFGKEIAYNEEIPEIGKENSVFFRANYKLGENINLMSSINYARLRNINETKSFYDGYISRFTFRYQFNNDLSIRLVSEYNKFNDTFLIQPLFKWNPNPSTIFYIGGIQSSINDFNLDPEEFNPFLINRSQFFIKFQYLIGI
jgi:hypothetical protein